MKKIVFTLPIFALTLFLFSCGNSNKKPSVEWADNYCENLVLRLDLCKSAYETFVNVIPEEAMIGGSIGPAASYEVMTKTFTEQKALLDKTEVFDGAEEDEKLSQKMKDLTGAIIDIYIDGGKKELLNVKEMTDKGETIYSDGINAELDSFEDRLNKAYEEFGKEQEVYAKKYGIILY